MTVFQPIITVIPTRMHQNGLKRIFGEFLLRSVRILKFSNLALGPGWVWVLIHAQNRLRSYFLFNHTDVGPGFLTIYLVFSELGAFLCTTASHDRDEFLRRNPKDAFGFREYPGPCNSLSIIFCKIMQFGSEDFFGSGFLFVSFTE